jgi:hypothetical protein
MPRNRRIVLTSWIVLTAASGMLPAQAAPPSTQEPVPVIVQNTRLPVEITNTPIAIVPAERAGLVVQGTVAAGQSGPWTVDLAPGAKVAPAPRTMFRWKLTPAEPVTNTTTELLVIERVSAQNNNSYAISFHVSAIEDTFDIRDRLTVPATRVEEGSGLFLHATTQIYIRPGEKLWIGLNDEVWLSGHYEPLPQP